ncbi:IS4 family transposase, partial [Herpetosiphon gulosus]|uniref:IS4 family transposase n=1 Tax=Herpetosiphon gulosus TaxID=1973496 RepID=UPI0031EC059D
MRFSLRSIPTDTRLPDALTVDLFTHVLPPTSVMQALTHASRRQQRVRKLSHASMIWLVVAMHLWSHLSIEHVFQKLIRGLRFIWPDSTFPLPSRSALCYRRYQLGARPFVTLFHQCCVPLATPATPDAFLFGYRLMAIDSTTEIVPDTPRNEAVFGRMRGSRGASAFPQLRAVYLVECGTHAIVDAGFWPCLTHERVGGYRMLRKLQPNMLLMWDRGFHSYRMFAQAQARGAQVLARLSLSVRPQIYETLADGSALITITPVNHGRPVREGGIQLRMISYRLTDPALGDTTTMHRVVTSLLDPSRYPAADLVCAYHERWEIALVIDELDTHQRIARQPLRSQQPVGVIQELYGLLLAHYCIRTVIHDAARTRTLD